MSSLKLKNKKWRLFWSSSECALNGPSGLKYFPCGIYRAFVGARVRLSDGRYVWDSVAPPSTRRGTKFVVIQDWVVWFLILFEQEMSKSLELEYTQYLRQFCWPLESGEKSVDIKACLLLVWVTVLPVHMVSYNIYLYMYWLWKLST